MTGLEYWKECIAIAAEDCGLELTDEQIAYLAESVQGGHENYGMAFGYDAIPCPADTQATRELAELKRDQKARDNWINSTKPCRGCVDGTAKDGWGREVTCYTCDGKGRVRA